ncbi:hypothetical protein SPRG_03924 [Saprolegnia parasitica CBS 223.65]|uniref:Uncharacterized protein n=1 Tax=Saprolegnia parasitica (strain CBS 223.65) TaxID=695850 RepID=A0A067CLC9_SAPPC|nr:hypothetical protein SPRG_03924 [Saprolegnia parasitica CBS 223.65]KDO31308.1 hypothetical protein SPRG_03924 [Saprolegnia parasitica CBS 223.65]|eukprot:XP_012197907.1 hypothetical protein SPRG_03924 [Saprolegnia parasitica CBS 223.65]
MNVSWYPKAALTEQPSCVVPFEPLSPSGQSGPVVPPHLGRRRLVYYTTLAVWVFLSLNSFLDPFKTLYGYYLTTDSHEHASVWALQVTNAFNNISSTVCDQGGPFLNCYFELPVFGVGSLAGAVCRSYYPVDMRDTQHIGIFFGNCTLPSGVRLDLPNEEVATSQWSVLTSSTQKDCLDKLGEGDAFPCDTYTTANGRVIHHRLSRTETDRWCKEFGGYYILNKTSNKREILVANASVASAPVFTSLVLDVETPVFSLHDILGCPATFFVGGTADHISTTSWYGDTIGAWTARTTRSPYTTTLTRRNKLVSVAAFTWHDGGITQIRSISKDLLRCCLLLLVAYFRVSSIYYPIWLVFRRQGQPFWTWAGGRHMGLVLHKRERRCLAVLFLLSFEALLSTEDIVMFCQHAVYTVPTSYTTIALTYMSITRIIWPSAFLLLALSRLLEWLFGPKYAFALSEDLFLLGAPVVWFYLPSYVTTQGMKLFQGYRWTGVVVHHYVNTIHNAYSHQKDSWALYVELFGYFTLLSSLLTIVLGFVWQSVTHMTSILAFLLSRQRYRRVRELKGTTGTLEAVLLGAADGLSPEIAFQVTKAKWPRSQRCEGMNLASEGLLCLVYGSTHVLATVEWGIVGPVLNPQGHAAVIEGHSVSFRPDVTRDTLSSITPAPARVGIPDLI